MLRHGCADHDVDPITQRPEPRRNTIPRMSSHDDSIFERDRLAHIARTAHHVVVMLRLDDMARNDSKVRHVFRETPWERAASTDAISCACRDDGRQRQGAQRHRRTRHEETPLDARRAACGSDTHLHSTTSAGAFGTWSC